MSICQQSHPPLCVPLGCMTIGGDMSTVKKVLLIQLPILALSGVTLLNRLDNPAFNMQSPLTGTYNRKIMMWTLNLREWYTLNVDTWMQKYIMSHLFVSECQWLLCDNVGWNTFWNFLLYGSFLFYGSSWNCCHIFDQFFHDCCMESTADIISH